MDTYIIALDPDQENQVRGVFIIPPGVSYEAAEQAVVAAYEAAAESTDFTDAVDVLENEGFTSVSFLTTRIS